MKTRKIMKRLLSVVLVFAMMFSLVACGGSPPPATLSDSNNQIVVENTEQEHMAVETTEFENIYTEFITEEIYTKEIVEAENKITELLLEEETISEVVACKTIYVPQEHIDDFAENSQTLGLFEDGADLKPLLKKVAVGTGVIVTLVVLKKVGIPNKPIASVICAAADKSLQFAEGGAVIGSLFGGLTGATDEIDESGITSAILGFATAVAGLAITTASLVATIPSGGSTTITAAAGIKLVIAGVSVIGATAGTVHAGVNAVKTFTATDGTDIDWSNVDWNAVGVSAAEKAINNGADGYMWGSIVGTVYGGVEGYDFYQKYNTPYTAYNARLMQTPKEGGIGKWAGERGESEFVLDDPIKLPDGTEITKIEYKNAVPDFSKYQKAQVKIPNMTNNRSKNFSQANKELADYWTEIKYDGKSWSARDVETYRSDNNLTWHEMSNMESMQLVPAEVNQTFTHFGGVAEYNAMIGQEGEFDFD